VEMHGPEAACIMRNELGYQGPIIGITGNVFKEDSAKFIKGGADVVLNKPVNKDELLRIIREKGCDI